MRILFHGPGFVSFRPAGTLPHSIGVQATTTTKIAKLQPSYWTTGNRGNLIHAEAPTKIFEKDNTASCYANIARLQESLGRSYASRLADEFDAIIISMANFIRPDHDGTPLYEALKGLKGKVKFFVVGAGIQGREPLSEHLPGNRNLISIFNEQAQVFGLRGEQTQEWLVQHGFNNGTVLGCPSLFAHPASIMSLNYDAAVARGKDCRIMTAGHLRVPQLQEVAPNRRGLDYAEAFKGVPSSYVFQDEILGYDTIKRLPGVFNEGTSELDAATVNGFFQKDMGQDIGFDRYYYFNEAGAWRMAARNHDVFIGDRFHGGVAALQASVPAIFLAYDSRVEELTKFFGLPALTIREFREIGVEGAIQKTLTQENLANLKATYRKRYDNFRSVMEAKGLKVGNGDFFKSL